MVIIIDDQWVHVITLNTVANGVVFIRCVEDAFHHLILHFWIYRWVVQLNSFSSYEKIVSSYHIQLNQFYKYKLSVIEQITNIGAIFNNWDIW